MRQGLHSRASAFIPFAHVAKPAGSSGAAHRREELVLLFLRLIKLKQARENRLKLNNCLAS